jgi:poly(hydroxyalkanoate) depolymerase family esterase
MPRRRSTRAFTSGLRALLPDLRRRPSRKPKAAPARKPARQAVAGTWVAGSHIGPEGGRSYDVYVPAGLRRRTAAPLVVLLHGCGQTPAEFADATRFTAAADRNGFLLAVPHQQTRHHPQRCWRWYDAAHQRRGAGEPAVIAGIVAQVAAEETRWRVDQRRVYVAGISAGAAMALTVAAAYPDVFAAVGAHSAPAYRSSSGPAQALAAMGARTEVPAPLPGATALPPAIVVQGRADSVVRPQNGDRVADQWLAHRAAAPGDDPVARSRSDTGNTTDGRTYQVLRWYTARGRKVLEYWSVDRLGHAWSGGRKNGSFSDPAGPRATTLMWAFFRLHALDRRAGRRLAPAAGA